VKPLWWAVPTLQNILYLIASGYLRLYPDLNLMVYSSNIKVLVQLKHQIDNHQGGFTIADKILETAEVQRRMQHAADGITFTKEIRKGLELKPEWLSTLQLADEGLQDKAISEKISASEQCAITGLKFKTY
jgi:hypothetical protein